MKILNTEVAEKFTLKTPSERVVLPNNQEVDFRKIDLKRAREISLAYPDLLEEIPAKATKEEQTKKEALPK